MLTRPVTVGEYCLGEIGLTGAYMTGWDEPDVAKSDRLDRNDGANEVDDCESSDWSEFIEVSEYKIGDNLLARFELDEL
jgi:hypothetical protein